MILNTFCFRQLFVVNDFHVLGERCHLGGRGSVTQGAGPSQELMLSCFLTQVDIQSLLLCLRGVLCSLL